MNKFEQWEHWRLIAAVAVIRATGGLAPEMRKEAAIDLLDRIEQGNRQVLLQEDALDVSEEVQ